MDAVRGAGEPRGLDLHRQRERHGGQVLPLEDGPGGRPPACEGLAAAPILTRPTRRPRQHPHTNMAKASLNMMTRTSAQVPPTSALPRQPDPAVTSAAPA